MPAIGLGSSPNRCQHGEPFGTLAHPEPLSSEFKFCYLQRERRLYCRFELPARESLTRRHASPQQPMYDILHLRFDIPPHDHEALARMKASPAFENCPDQLDEHNCLKFSHRGLRIDYKPYERSGRVRGSLHTFALGNNRGSFTADMVESACIELAQVLGVPAGWLRVYKLEIGVNIETPTSPEPFLNSLLHHKRKPFWPISPPRNANRPFQFEATYREYRIKFYDKGAYDRSKGELPKTYQPLMRFELVLSSRRRLLAVAKQFELTLADLASPALLQLFSNHLSEQWGLVQRKMPMRFVGRPLQEALLLHAVHAPEVWADTKPTTPASTFSYYRRKCDRLWKHFRLQTGPNLFDALFIESLHKLLPGAAE